MIRIKSVAVVEAARGNLTPNPFPYGKGNNHAEREQSRVGSKVFLRI
jgi:hypothetical protein